MTAGFVRRWRGSRGARRDRAALVDLLAPSLGRSESRQAVDEAAEILGFDQDLGRKGALDVLREMERSSALSRMASRFARTRVWMEW